MFDDPFLPISEFTPASLLGIPLMGEAASIEDLEEELRLDQEVDDLFDQLYEDEAEFGGADSDDDYDNEDDF